MKYSDGTTVSLNDIVQISMPDGPADVRIVMLGDTREHSGIDKQFREWVAEEGLLDPDAVLVEWVGENPLAHKDPASAPVGDFMFMRLGCCDRKVS